MEFVDGGYFLTKRGPYGRATGPAPRGNYITLSNEFIDFFPDDWAVSWVNMDEADRQRSAAALAIPLDFLPALTKKVEELFNAKVFYWPNVIPSIAAARRLLGILPLGTPWLLIGFGIATQDIFDSNPPPPRPPGYAPMGSSGVDEMLRAPRPLEPGYTELGFDVLNIDAGMVSGTHLLCNLRAVGAYDGELNADGLLPDLATARKVAGVLSDNPALGTPRRFVAAKIVGYDPTVR